MKRSPEIRMVRVRQSLLSSGERGSCRAGDAKVRQEPPPPRVANLFSRLDGNMFTGVASPSPSIELVESSTQAA